MVTHYLELVERRFGDDLDEDCKEFMGFAVDGARRRRRTDRAVTSSIRHPAESFEAE